MVGYFAPLIPRIRKTGCRLDIIELNSYKPGTIRPETADLFKALDDSTWLRILKNSGLVEA